MSLSNLLDRCHFLRVDIDEQVLAFHYRNTALKNWLDSAPRL